MNIKLLIDGGDMKPGPAIAQQLGPIGINMGKVISEVNKATQEFKGVKVPVELIVDEKTKNFTVKTSSPPTAELLKKELGFEKGSANQKIYIANASLQDVIKVTKIKYSNMLQRDFISAVKSVLGTCASNGILVENANANDFNRNLKDNKNYLKIIEDKISETPSERRKELNTYFNEVKTAQENKQKLEKAAAEEAAAKKTEAVATPATAAKSATPATPVKEEKKPEEKKKK
ncbi:MAG: hypothetical protein WC438_00980 [Candidatus Pacearchaeota archaeon]